MDKAFPAQITEGHPSISCTLQGSATEFVAFHFLANRLLQFEIYTGIEVTPTQRLIFFLIFRLADNVLVLGHLLYFFCSEAAKYYFVFREGCLGELYNAFIIYRHIVVG
ncbi:hypothetical protein EUZ85_12185 [Hahella sp. KA22]|uniref:hypothetical protein n=1 Tax=Hahella sp. KA22 TaxID=1628392 RepID=UPI000FDD13C3|nr:hypothetical protein [Hahella sp. KA22]AZZ91452.1 hypothetical protein ENC22_09625 [Hahella sp. KA22]QAY54821.1 hypothetical protein EUZ85_12185 [Hahella sp. KA22]